jgi:hypothetical protein
VALAWLALATRTILWEVAEPLTRQGWHVTLFFEVSGRWIHYWLRLCAFASFSGLQRYPKAYSSPDTKTRFKQRPIVKLTVQGYR